MRKILYSLFFILLIPVTSVWATHIRAGEIIARRTNALSLTYEIILRGYTDRDSDVIFGSNGTLDFGDGTRVQFENTGCDDPFVCSFIDARTRFYEAKIIHTYPGPGSYVVSFSELYRNDNVLNIDNSVGTTFYVETLLDLRPIIGSNSTPELFAPPIEQAQVGRIYTHNPAAYDPDGDSLSYELIPNRQARDVVANNYRYPNESFPSGDVRNGSSISGNAPTFTIFNNGDLVWDTPGYGGEGNEPAEYNAAFKVIEWREIAGVYTKIGYVVRDMQIVVYNSENNPPVIKPLKNLCVVAGTKIEFNVEVTDVDEDKVKVTASGGPINRQGATFSINNLLVNTPALGTFTWQTDCSDVREQPWQVSFTAIDTGNVSPKIYPQLSDVETIQITVIAPPPVLNELVTEDNSFIVDFDLANYTLNCLDDFDRSKKGNDANSNAIQYQLWRRIGEGPELVTDACYPGMPPNAGFEQIGLLKADQFPFIDTNPEPGLTYCYAIVAEFPAQAFGFSLVSNVVCARLPAIYPLITKVDIRETSQPNGKIDVAWVAPPEPDPLLPGPYTYELYRAEGFSAAEAGYTFIEKFADGDDLAYQDVGLDTENKVYNYKILLYNADGSTLYGESSSASSVKLSLVPQQNSILLKWDAQVPYSIRSTEYPYHLIYRAIKPEGQAETPNLTDFSLLATVDIRENGLTYLDNNGPGDKLDDELEYCYRVLTRGSYQLPEIANLDPLENYSQVSCSFTQDALAPCPPPIFNITNFTTCEEFLATSGCDNLEYINRLEWDYNPADDCNADIDRFEIYSSSDGINFELVATIIDDGNFVYEDPLGAFRTYARYYFIRAVDFSGNISERSTIISRDNCPNYWLPNFVKLDATNGNESLRPPLDNEITTVYDGNLDIFKSRCPRFVEQVEITIYNRWGKEVYSYNSKDNQFNNSGEEIPEDESIYIKWDGRTNQGGRVSAGTYYYNLKIIYDVLNPEDRIENRRGWVDIYESGDVQPK